eukprot:g16444.t1
MLENVYNTVSLDRVFLCKWGKLHSSDVAVNGVKVIHRSAGRMRDVTKRTVKLTADIATDAGDPATYTLDVDDEFDILCAMLYNEETDRLTGVYFFGKDYLNDWGMLSHQRQGGQSSLTIYPPGCNPPRPLEKYEEFAKSQQQRFTTKKMPQPPPADLDLKELRKLHSCLSKAELDLTESRPGEMVAKLGQLVAQTDRLAQVHGWKFVYPAERSSMLRVE